jgi:hypothetical protein
MNVDRPRWRGRITLPTVDSTDGANLGPSQCESGMADGIPNNPQRQGYTNTDWAPKHSLQRFGVLTARPLNGPDPGHHQPDRCAMKTISPLRAGSNGIKQGEEVP